VFISTLKLPKSMNQDTLAHKDFKVLLHGLRLARQVHYQGLALGAYDSP